MVRIGYLRAFMLLIAIAAAAAVAVMVAYGLASAQGQPEEPPPPPPCGAGCPTVTYTIPSEGATNVDRDAAYLLVAFSEKMNASTFDNTTVNLYAGNYSSADLNPVPTTGDEQPPPPPPSTTATVSYLDVPPRKRYKKTKKNKKMKSRPPMHLAIVVPVSQLDPNTQYTLVIEGVGDYGNESVTDRAGNSLAADSIVHFTTGAN